MRGSRLLVAAAIVAAPFAGVAAAPSTTAAPVVAAVAAPGFQPVPPRAPSYIVCGDQVTKPSFLLVRTPAGGHRLVAAKFGGLLTERERRHAEPCLLVVPSRIQP